MATVEIFQQDVVEWIANHEQEKFHALICDPPYFLDTIKQRFGNMSDDSKGVVANRIKDRSDALARLASGFLGQDWDTDIAMHPETWQAFMSILHPGAICMAFSHSRLYHRMASAIEAAGYIIYPMIAWINGQGFPHPTKSNRDGYYYNRNVLKGAIEPICVFQMPYEGTLKENIEVTGAGAWWIDGARISGEPYPINILEEWSGFGEKVRPKYEQTINTDGRWPANVIIEDGFDLPFDEFFYQAKPSRKEKDAGLNKKNSHPTIKPIDLIRYLATTILPPEEFKPRRLFVPFAGTGSEMIGAHLAGWDDVVGVELEKETVDIAISRINHWTGVNGKEIWMGEENAG